MELNISKSLVLFVGQNQDIFNYLGSAFKDAGVVKSCDDEQTAWRMIWHECPDIVLLDDALLGFDLPAFCWKLKNNNRVCFTFIGVIVSSAQSRTKSLQVGADFCIERSLDLRLLLSQIRNISRTLRSLVDSVVSSSLNKNPMESTFVSQNDLFLRRVASAVEQMLDDPELNVESLSKKLGISANYLYRKVKKLKGQTVIDFIFNMRIDTSTKLLLANDMTISEVAYNVGFNSPSYFSRRFREKYGCSPREYIDGVQKQTQPIIRLSTYTTVDTTMAFSQKTV